MHSELLSTLDKGLPALARQMQIAEIGQMGWGLFDEDLPLPVAVIKQSALHKNSAWLKAFATQSKVDFAPHGKTTMAPALFDLQREDGAWAITVSTPHQIRAARAFGAKRLIMANQLVGKRAILDLVADLNADPEFDFYFLIDSAKNVQDIARIARSAGLKRPLQVLVELGYSGGRTGARSLGQGLALCREVSLASDVFVLRGIEGFEGMIRGSDTADRLQNVQSFLTSMAEFAEAADAAGYFKTAPVLLSAGGSSFYDQVAARLLAVQLSLPSQVIVRAGCYLTHDNGLYTRAVAALRERDPELAAAHGGLQPALEVWGYVQSRPEPGKLIAAIGKRDVSHDDMPVLLYWYRPDSGMRHHQPVTSGHVVTALNDQHAHLDVPEDCALQVGDMIGFGISHPCLTFDKWRVLLLVDDEYRVTGAVRTYF